MECGREASTSKSIKILLFLVLAFMVSFTLQQVKTKYRSGITQSARIFTTPQWLCLANENTGCRLLRVLTVWKVRMILLVLVLRRISFSIGSSLLLAPVLASVLKTRLKK